MIDINYHLNGNINFYHQIMNKLNTKYSVDPFTYFLCGKLSGFTVIEWSNIYSCSIDIKHHPFNAWTVYIEIKFKYNKLSSYKWWIFIFMDGNNWYKSFISKYVCKCLCLWWCNWLFLCCFRLFYVFIVLQFVLCVIQ